MLSNVIEIDCTGYQRDGKKAIKTKSKLYKIHKHDTSFNKYVYTQYENTLTSILRKHEKEYYKKLLEMNKDSMKNTWSINTNVINNLKQSKLNESFSNYNSIITDKKIISDKFNDYFINVGKTLAAQMPKFGPSFEKYLPESIFLVPTNDREISNTILNTKNSAQGIMEYQPK